MRPNRYQNLQPVQPELSLHSLRLGVHLPVAVVLVPVTADTHTSNGLSDAPRLRDCMHYGIAPSALLPVSLALSLAAPSPHLTNQLGDRNAQRADADELN